MASNGRILDLDRANMLARVLHELQDAVETLDQLRPTPQGLLYDLVSVDSA